MTPTPAEEAPEECPCGTGRAYSQCCGKFHEGQEHPASPEELMRSRYSAFALMKVEYLRFTWAPENVPVHLALDPQQQWTRLRIIDAPAPTADEGIVHYRAHYRYGQQRDFLEEISRFRRHAGHWVYVDGEILS
ncbi:YchJ family protein [Timonella sp. A28]|uniref:YchJ family protein n=1 Tax=Timonella sp. A28 TaxID=3442640 RepID=UPI003EBAF658